LTREGGKSGTSAQRDDAERTVQQQSRIRLESEAAALVVD